MLLHVLSIVYNYNWRGFIICESSALQMQHKETKQNAFKY